MIETERIEVLCFDLVSKNWKSNS